MPTAREKTTMQNKNGQISQFGFVLPQIGPTQDEFNELYSKLLEYSPKNKAWYALFLSAFDCYTIINAVIEAVSKFPCSLFILVDFITYANDIIPRYNPNVIVHCLSENHLWASALIGQQLICRKNIPCDSMQWLTKQPNFSYFQTHSSQKNTTKQATVARKRKMKKIVQPAIPRHAVLVETRWWYRRKWWWKRLGLTFCHVPRSWEFFHYYSRRRTMKTYNLQNKAKC